MAHSVTRRDCLLSLTAGSVAALGLGNHTVTAGEPTPKRSSHMKLSLAAYSFNRFLLKRPDAQALANASMTLSDFVDYCASLNLDGCELTGYYFPKVVTQEVLTSLKQQTFRLGLDISGTAIGNDFCVKEGTERDAELKAAREWIDYAAALGAPVIRIFAGKVPKDDQEEAALERCIDGINQSLDYAAKKGVFLALENHGGITATPAQMMKIINGVKSSPWFGVNFDSGNFKTDDPYRDLAVIAPYAINAQIKVKMTVEGQHVPADLPRVISILKDAGYRGYVVLEYEEKTDPKTEIPKYIKQLHKLIYA